MLSEPLAPTHPDFGFFRGAILSARAVFARRDLVKLLVRREVRARYKDSSLGIVWSLARPLAQLGIYYFAIGKLLELERQIPSFAIFVFVGLSAWGLFTEIVTKGVTAITSNAGLVKKVYLPREVFPLATTGSALFNFAVQLGILLVVVIAARQVPPVGTWIYAIAGFAVILVFGTAVAMLLSALTVNARDLEHLVEVAVVILFWASPIVYSFAFVDRFAQGSRSWLHDLYLSNPVTLGVMGMQRGLWGAGSNDGAAVWPSDLGLRLGIALALSLAFLWISQRVFDRLQGNFAQEV